MRIDLGAIGKGYAIEAARKIMQEKGTKKALIDMHSSIAAIGGPWRIGIFDPRAQNTEKNILGVVILNNREALSTSAQYEQPGHIIDPRTGQAANLCYSVTITGRNAGLADALSTAVFVLGPERGLALIKALNYEGLIIKNNGEIIKTQGFFLGK